MSVENKIKELLSRAGDKEQVLTEESKEDLTSGGMADVGAKASTSMSKDSSKAATAATAGDSTSPKQGSSQDASYTEHDEDEENLGAKASASVASNVGLPKSKGDAKTAKVPAMEETEESIEWVINEEDEDNATAKVAGHKVTLHRGLSDPGTSDTYTLHHPSGDKKVKISFSKHGDGDEVHGEKVNQAFGLDSKHKLGHKIAGSMNGMGGISKFQESVNIKSQLNSIFGEELSEEFRTKATSIFEAAVIARVNNEMESVTARLEEQAQTQLDEHKAGLVEKVDSYLNYVIEQWMEENTLAVENGLRTEIAEDFITGLKSLFKEHYIEVPEEKYDVLEELQNKAEELEAKLNEAVNQIVSTSTELSTLKQSKIFEEQTKDLAATEVEKLKKLVEGVEFEQEELYREKVAVIKENYFPKTASKSPEKILVEESGTTPSTFDNSTMSKYVQSLSRTVKTR
jgi:hypothetical protein